MRIPQCDGADLYNDCRQLMAEHDLTFDQAFAIASEVRREHYLDIKDEQLASFGAILEEFTGAVQEMSGRMNEISETMMRAENKPK